MRSNLSEIKIDDQQQALFCLGLINNKTSSKYVQNTHLMHKLRQINSMHNNHINSTNKQIYNLLDKVQPILDNMQEVICCKNMDYKYTCCNKRFINFSKLHSPKELLDHTDFDMPWADGISFYRKLDDEVLQGRSFKTLMSLRIGSGEEKLVLQNKYPLRTIHGAPCGIVIRLTQIKNTQLLQKIMCFMNKELIVPELANYISKKFLIKKTYFDNITAMESVCLFYLIRGKTTKEIASIVNRSPKTIDKHVENLKAKLNCYNKSSLIAYAHSQGLMFIIPEILLNRIIMTTK